MLSENHRKKDLLSNGINGVVKFFENGKNMCWEI